MNQQIDAYIESLVLGCLQHPNFATLPDEQKQQTADQLRNKFYDVILDTVIDRLTEEQLNELQSLPADSADFEMKIEEFSAQIPNLATDLENSLNKEYERIRQTGQIGESPLLSN